MVSEVKINGIKHEVIECEDTFDVDCHFGMIDYKKCKIKINKDMTEEMKNQALCHEILHGMLVSLGYNDLANDETFVQGLSGLINQTFSVK